MSPKAPASMRCFNEAPAERGGRRFSTSVLATWRFRFNEAPAERGGRRRPRGVGNAKRCRGVARVVRPNHKRVPTSESAKAGMCKPTY